MPLDSEAVKGAPLAIGDMTVRLTDVPLNRAAYAAIQALGREKGASFLWRMAVVLCVIPGNLETGEREIERRLLAEVERQEELVDG